MDQPADVPTAQAAVKAATDQINAAQRELDRTTTAYEIVRRHQEGQPLQRARAEWAMAVMEWARALVDRAWAVDRLTVARRHAADDAPSCPSADSNEFERTFRARNNR